LRTFNKWIVASGAFNHGPVREFENHPIWASDPKLKMLPKEGEFGHPRGWPYHQIARGLKRFCDHIVRVWGAGDGSSRACPNPLAERSPN
jgi:hypothetical protein